MKALSASALLLAGLTLARPAAAQISFGGQPYGLDASARARLMEAPVAAMPAVDARSLMLEDEARALQGVKGPYRFGFNHAVDLSLGNSGSWTVMPNGDAVWRLALSCPDAMSINFEFNEYVVPEGGRIYVYNEDGDVYGAFTAESNPGHAELGVFPMGGERITIEYIEPAAVRGEGRLRIGQVTHGYRDVLHRSEAKGFGTSGSCNNNTICPEADNWRQQIRSVAMIVAGGSGICTGQLLNNCNQDGTPYFLTANHCVSGSNVGTWVFRFLWESPTCTPTQNAATNKTISGSTLKVNSSGSDVALLQLNATPPASYNAWYTGWDATGTLPANQTCIHHPDGDIKKISFDYNGATMANWGSPSAATWRIGAWDDGTTEPGSSGSGLWNQDGRLIGQLYGGTASCSSITSDYFGRFNVSYPLLQTWLGTCATTLDGYPQTITGTMEPEPAAAIALVPNPTTGQLFVTLPQAMQQGGRIAVFDALGQHVMTRNVPAMAERISLDLSEREPGVYFVEASLNGQRSVQRLVISR
jgi:V8-like Glu-specific endopeptidase